MSRQLARETAFKMIFQMDVGKNSLEMAEYTMEEALIDGDISKGECKYILKRASSVWLFMRSVIWIFLMRSR